MKEFLKRLIIRSVLQKDNSKKAEKIYSPFRIAKGFREARIGVVATTMDLVLITLGVASAAFGLESFLIPSKFIDGGVTGTALLLNKILELPFPLLLIGLNLPFILIGYNTVSKTFAVKTAIAVSLLATVTATFHFPVVTQDKLLVAAFGGFFLGAGIGLCIRGGAVIDGTEVLAIFISRKLSTTVGDIIIVINIIIFSVAAYFLSIEAALYSMITYLAASKTLDFVVEGIEEYLGVTIISSHSEEIREMIINKIGRGVTVYRGKRGYGKKGHTDEIDIVYTVITRLELSRLNTEIQKIDPHSFVVMNTLKDIKGGMIKKRPLH